MKFVNYFSSEMYKIKPQVSEWILCDERLSLNHKTFGKIEELPQEFDPSTFSLEADRLITESEFEAYLDLVKKFYGQGVRRFRVKDIGILNYFSIASHLEQCPEIKFIFNLESGGHHNYESIIFYEKNYGAIIEKLIISTEITFENLSEILAKVKLPIEIYGLGPILLFYTPRKLLNNQIKQELQNLPEGKQELIATGTSMESPHSGFDIIQNSGGTLMYAPNHFCLLDYVDRLKEIGIDAIRVDLRGVEDTVQKEILNNYLSSLGPEKLKEFRKLYPVRVLKGLFVVNKSKVLFKKLKNKTLENVQDHHAMVVEVAKDSHMLIKQTTATNLKVKDQILIQSPDGREKKVTLKWIKDLAGSECEQTRAGKHFIIDVVPAISIKSKITILN